MTDLSSSHPSPHRARTNLWTLMFGTCAAPLFWLGQSILAYTVSDLACYGGDHPTLIASGTVLRSALFAFDAVAIIGGIAGGLVSYLVWRAVHDEKEGGPAQAIDIGDGRTRFMALWGIMSSLWFLAAILFETIGSATVPLCVG